MGILNDSNLQLRQENERLAALHSYHITDTFSEAEYDQIAKLASAICGTPVALVTFVDENWQWFKAKVGTDFDGTPREIAFTWSATRIVYSPICAYGKENEGAVFTIRIPDQGYLRINKKPFRL